MPPNHVVNRIVWGILAEAHSRYKIRVCHLLFMANHLHMIAVIDDPEDVSAFMRYVKSEISHAVNRLLGRMKKTIWSEGYDSPLLLTPDRVIHYIKYIYLNPVKASLVDSIEDYPGVSTWEMFTSGRDVVSWSRVPRVEIRRLSTATLSVSEQKALVKRWELLDGEAKSFVLEPWAWLECFPGLNRETIFKKILDEIKLSEQSYREKRFKEKRRIIGATALRRQSMTKEHVPHSRGRRMIVLCEDVGLRRRFISFYRLTCSSAREAYRSWRRGDLRPKIPPGLFPPKLPVLCSALSV